MSFAVLARSQAVRQVRARAFHTTGPVRAPHGEYHHLPFAWPGNKKAAFGAKVFLYLITGFSIPFIATKYQLIKSQGA
ncbi:hypothetical protein Hypma_010294 [Hypsizygus marmoreus]|uniref:Cytochrome c oxidase subunit 8, mitochondrial n=1 Tax=Hypsizygus marmoreus TaxID=39966 RepID=A0A369JKF2_HYPMA|nr:hypothetical protein Hypma_010294 [Hypsizygus marmoreus]